MEEGPYDDLEDKPLSRRLQALIALLSFVALFTLFCLIIWGASRPFKAHVSLKVINLLIPIKLVAKLFDEVFVYELNLFNPLA